MGDRQGLIAGGLRGGPGSAGAHQDIVAQRIVEADGPPVRDRALGEVLTVHGLRAQQTRLLMQTGQAGAHHQLGVERHGEAEMLGLSIIGEGAAGVCRRSSAQLGEVALVMATGDPGRDG